MNTTRLAMLITLVICWMPYGLIHQGQRRVTPSAQPVVGMFQPQCNPADPQWGGCR